MRMFEHGNLLTTFPFQSDSIPTMPISDYRYTTPEAFVSDFYACKFTIKQRDLLSPFIHHLIKMYQVVAEKKVVVAQLKFIYICLTRLHFHVTCHCCAVKHNYYDHLYQLLCDALEPIELTIVAEWQVSEIFDYWVSPIATSMGFTCLPMFRLLVERGVKQGRITMSLLTTLLQHFTKTQRLYIRYVDTKDMSAYGAGYSDVIFRVSDQAQCYALHDIDFRGSYFNQVRITDTNYDYPPSMKNADLRCSSWINVFHSVENGVYVNNLDGSDFTNMYVSPPEKVRAMLKTHVTFAGQPTVFPPFKKNSCYFNYQPPAKLRPPKRRTDCTLL